MSPHKQQVAPTLRREASRSRARARGLQRCTHWASAIPAFAVFTPLRLALRIRPIAALRRPRSARCRPLLPLVPQLRAASHSLRSFLPRLCRPCSLAELTWLTREQTKAPDVGAKARRVHVCVHGPRRRLLGNRVTEPEQPRPHAPAPNAVRPQDIANHRSGSEGRSIAARVGNDSITPPKTGLSLVASGSRTGSTHAIPVSGTHVMPHCKPAPRRPSWRAVPGSPSRARI